MPRYEIDVVEVRTYQVRYTVEAESEEEALELAEDGETADEYECGLIAVIDRTIDSGSLTLEGGALE